MSYRDTLLDLAEGTSRRTGALWDAVDTGAMSGDFFIEVTAVEVATANVRATLLGDLMVAAHTSVDLGRPVPAIGIRPPDDLVRLRKAAATLLQFGTRGRAVRLGRVEPLDAAARAVSEAVKRSRHVKGWERVLGPDPCPMCQSWARGAPRPADAHFPTHKGCSCVQRPVTIKKGNR